MNITMAFYITIGILISSVIIGIYFCEEAVALTGIILAGSNI